MSLENQEERIAKRMARAGLCSRRQAEQWILEGRVCIDGKVIETPATLVTNQSFIEVDGKPLREKPSPRLWIYYKPVGVVTTHHDPQGRPTLFSTLPSSLPRVISVGRLDLNSEGLILLTNDGKIARYAELPGTGWARSYRVRVYGKIDSQALKALRKGITIEGITYGSIEVDILNDLRNTSLNTWLYMTLYEGKNREIRKVMAYLGLRVNRLIRVAYGPFVLDKLHPQQIEEIPPSKLWEIFSIPLS